MAKDNTTAGQSSSQIAPESDKIDKPLSLADMQQTYG